MTTDQLSPFPKRPITKRKPVWVPPPLISVPLRRKVFVSYSHLDEKAVKNFIERFSGPTGVFIAKALGVSDKDDFINSTNTDYVMSKIREKYIQDSTVTMVLIGSCTHSRRYVDWEIKASLRCGPDNLPNGLLGIQLESTLGIGAHLPPRLACNWTEGHHDCYGRYWSYPTSEQQLRDLIEDAFRSRQDQLRTKWIRNSNADMMRNNSVCKIHFITH